MRLYDWQRECMDAWERGGRRGIAHVATGAGKTVLALEAIRRVRRQYPSAVVKIVVPSIPLAHQWKNALLRDGDTAGDRPGFFGGGRRDDPDTKIMIYIVNSARASLAAHVRRALSLGRQVLLICDECHHYASPHNRRIFDFLTPGVLNGGQYACLGLSATPLGTEDDAALTGALGPVIYRYDYDDAVREGVLSPFAVCEVSTSFSEQERAEYARLSEEIALNLNALFEAHPELKELGKLAFLRAVSRMARDSGMDPEDPAVAFLLKTYQRKEVSVLASSRVRCGLELLKRLSPEDRVLIFSERIAQAEDMTAAIRRRVGNVCALYHSGMTREARARSMAAFRDNTARVLVSCRCLDEGIDVPDANIGIVLSGSAVERQHVQRLGRLIRRAPGKDAACLYHISILESAEDPAFLPGLDPDARFSLRYYPAEGDFANDLYEYAAGTLLDAARRGGMDEKALRELRACLIEGLTRADWLLPEEVIDQRMQGATTIHDRNYLRAMKRLGREMTDRHSR